jgi:hypothetical protein
LPPASKTKPHPEISLDGAGLLDLVMSTPDWIECIVCCDSEEIEQLDHLRACVAGPVEPPWFFDVHEERERVENLLFAARSAQGLARSSSLSIHALRNLADRLATGSLSSHQAQIDQAPSACFSAQAIHPLPPHILETSGPESAGAMIAMMRLWGTPTPLRRAVALPAEATAMLTKRFGPIQGRYRWAVRFYAADWAPVPLLRHLSVRFDQVKTSMVSTF